MTWEQLTPAERPPRMQLVKCARWGWRWSIETGRPMSFWYRHSGWWWSRRGAARAARWWVEAAVDPLWWT